MRLTVLAKSALEISSKSHKQHPRFIKKASKSGPQGGPWEVSEGDGISYRKKERSKPEAKQLFR